MSFNQFILKEQYRKVQGLGDRLKLIKEQIDKKTILIKLLAIVLIIIGIIFVNL